MRTVGGPLSVSIGTAGVPPLRFSTDDLPARDRVAIWREVYGKTILRLDIDPLADRSFKADIRLHALPGLKIAAGTIGGTRDQRTRASLADGNDDLGMALNASGISIVSQYGREVTLGDGDGVLMSCGEPGSITRPAPSSYIGLRIPRTVLMRLVPSAEDKIGRLIPASLGILSLLSIYLAALIDNSEIASPEFQHLAVAHVYDLVALALGATQGASMAAEIRGVRAARLAAVKVDIRKNFCNRGLNLEALSGRHRVTPRYIQRLFEEDGTSFTEFVLHQRLHHAHRLLTHPGFADRTVSVIAFDSGFGDLSYFNRAFRRIFGATPSDIRAWAKESS